MTSAIVISTYNGEKYITKQLDSIRLQTVNPDKVIISDDGSSDKTPEIIRNYIEENELTSWFFYVNEQNLGWKKNFYKLIDECDTDLVFLADQDDVWNNRKLELMIPIFNNENVNLLACDYYNKSTNLDLKYKCNLNPVMRKIDFTRKFMWVNFPGCAYCIRKSYFNSIKMWWREWLPHDAFLFRNAMLDGTFYNIKSKLIMHRMHGDNAGTPKNFTQQKDDLQYYFDVLGLLKERAEKENINKEEIKILNKAILWLESRKRYYTTGSFCDFLKIANFIKFYPHFKTFIKEFFVVRKK